MNESFVRTGTCPASRACALDLESWVNLSKGCGRRAGV
jgi:hypothetical protein